MKLIPWLFLLSIPALAHAAENLIHLRAAVSAYGRGMSAQEAGNAAEAVAEFEKAIDIEPTYLQAYEQLSRLFVSTGRTADAGRMLTMLLQIQPHDAMHRVVLGQILMREGFSQRAVAQFSMALTQHPEDSDALAGFAAAAAGAGLKDKASAALARGRRDHPGDPRFQSTSKVPDEP